MSRFTRPNHTLPLCLYTALQLKKELSMRSLTTPLSRSKSAAMTRVLDCIPRGYTRYTLGTISAEKLATLIIKFQRLYAVAATPAQRITRKRHGKANAVLALYCPEGAETVQWLMLFTEGSLDAHERLQRWYAVDLATSE